MISQVADRAQGHFTDPHGRNCPGNAQMCIEKDGSLQTSGLPRILEQSLGLQGYSALHTTRCFPGSSPLLLSHPPRPRPTPSSVRCRVETLHPDLRRPFTPHPIPQEPPSWPVGHLKSTRCFSAGPGLLSAGLLAALAAAFHLAALEKVSVSPQFLQVPSYLTPPTAGVTSSTPVSKSQGFPWPSSLWTWPRHVTRPLEQFLSHQSPA